MKKYWFITLLFVTQTLFATKGLVVTQKFGNANNAMQHVTMTWYITETQCKMKMEFSDDKVNSVTWFIPDFTTNSLMTYTEGAVPSGASKVFYSIPVQNIQGGSEFNAASMQVNRTGEEKNFSGVDCEKVVVTTNNTTTEMWVTKGMALPFYKYIVFFKNSYELPGLSAQRLIGFPVSSTTLDVSGKEVSSTKLVSVTVRDIADGEFAIPSDYVSATSINATNK